MKFSVRIPVCNYTTAFKWCPRLINYISQKVTELTGQAVTQVLAQSQDFKVNCIHSRVFKASTNMKTSILRQTESPTRWIFCPWQLLLASGGEESRRWHKYITLCSQSASQEIFSVETSKDWIWIFLADHITTSTSSSKPTCFYFVSSPDPLNTLG